MNNTPSELFSKLTLTHGLIALALIIVLYTIGAYNGLTRSSLAADTQWAQVETQYQRRLDLVPNLVESVKGTMKQEENIFTAIADARTRYAGAASVSDRAEAATQYESAFGRLLAVMENYPQLKSAENVQALMAEIAGTENRVAVERGRFNEAVQAYNVRTITFPSALVARIFGFEKRPTFEAATGAENAPKVQF